MKTRVLLFSLVLQSIFTFAQTPIAYYPFSGDANDASGNDLHGTPYNVELTSDRFGNDNSAYYFDGTDSYIDLGNDPLLKRFNESFSISGWIKPMSYSSDFQSIILSNRNNSGAGSALALGGSKATERFKKAEFTVSGGYSASFGLGKTDLSTSEWYFITVTFHYSGNFDNQVRLYVNGQLDNIDTLSNVTDPANVPTYIGFEPSVSSPQEYHFQGAIDEVKIFNKALSDTEVRSLYLGKETGISGNKQTIDLTVFPDPSNGVFTLQSPVHLSQATITVHNSVGQTVAQKTLASISSSESFDLSAYGPGFYYISVDAAEGSCVKKMVVR